jgi:hypothetical protein
MMRRTETRRELKRLPFVLAGFFCCASPMTLAAPVDAAWIRGMNFGSLIIGAAGGTLSMDVSTGVRTGTGSVVPLAGGTLTQLRVDLTADPGVSVTITAPASVPITGINYGSVLTWTPTSDTPLIFNMPASGEKIINMAGDLVIPANTIADAFVGNITVSIDYTF